MSTRLVFLCDITGYSAREKHEQIEVVELLWATALKNLANYGLLLGRSRMWGTGDGFYLVYDDTKNSDKLSINKFAENLIKECQNSGIGLRIALHEGDVFDAKLPNKKTELCGPALNDAARMVSYAHNGQIIFHEYFLRSLMESGGKQEAKFTEEVLRPVKGMEPQAIEVKHGFRLLVRFNNSNQSRLMRETNVCTQAVLQELEAIRREFIGLVTESMENL